MALSPCAKRRWLSALRTPYSTLPPTTIPSARQYSDEHKARYNKPSNSNDPPAEPGPMARRLEQATEEALFTGGRAGRRAIEDAGFSEELKNRLLNKIADATFRDEHDTALREAGLVGNIPEAAGQGTRDVASAQPWTGEETQSDTVLRMLNDARKPLEPGLRGKPKIPSLSNIPVDMRLRKSPSISAGQKVANAKEAASVYMGMGIKDKDKDKGLSEKEREAFRKELRERFAPAARAVPNTISGLAALANERIEDAIARGQFRNIPRGVDVKRDTRADNPFIDTTEYIMNKMIKQQDLVPPWIEKQQEVVRTVNAFRARLRKDWKRHAARMIASRGGSLEEQMRRADEYARAEEVHNPRRRNSGPVAVPADSMDGVVADAQSQPAEPQVTLTRPFRDTEWETTEKSYMELAISNLNSLTRSYNLMAPELAKKPYFSLERELNACFADVAPQLSTEIKERAQRPEKSLLSQGGGGHQSRSLFGRFTTENNSPKIYVSQSPHYGFKEFWRDIWQRSP